VSEFLRIQDFDTDSPAGAELPASPLDALPWTMDHPRLPDQPTNVSRDCARDNRNSAGAGERLLGARQLR